MAELKTKVTNASVTDFLESVPDASKKADSYTLLSLFKNITSEAPKMWGSSIVGFGQYHYKSERSAQEGDWAMVGFSPRKQSLTLYVLTGFEGEKALLEKLGKHKRSVGCLYINKLSDVDLSILKQIVTKAYDDMAKKYPKK